MENWMIIVAGMVVIATYLLISTTGTNKPEGNSQPDNKGSEVAPDKSAKKKVKEDVAAGTVVKVDLSGGRTIYHQPNKGLTNVRCIEEFLTDAEKAYYQHLSIATKKKGFVILCKVRQADLDLSGWRSKFNKLALHQIDFVLCDLYSMKVMGCIELKDKNKQQGKHSKRCDEARYFFSSAEIPYAEVECANIYDLTETMDLLDYIRSPKEYMGRKAELNSELLAQASSLSEKPSSANRLVVKNRSSSAIQSSLEAPSIHDTYEEYHQSFGGSGGSGSWGHAQQDYDVYEDVTISEEQYATMYTPRPKPKKVPYRPQEDEGGRRGGHHSEERTKPPQNVSKAKKDDENITVDAERPKLDFRVPREKKVKKAQSNQE